MAKAKKTAEGSPISRSVDYVKLNVYGTLMCELQRENETHTSDDIVPWHITIEMK